MCAWMYMCTCVYKSAVDLSLCTQSFSVLFTSLPLSPELIILNTLASQLVLGTLIPTSHQLGLQVTSHAISGFHVGSGDTGSHSCTAGKSFHAKKGALFLLDLEGKESLEMVLRKVHNHFQGQLKENRASR